MQPTDPIESPKPLKEIAVQFLSELAGKIGFGWTRGVQAPLVPIAFLLTFAWVLAKNLPAPHPEYSLGTLILGLGSLGVILFSKPKSLRWIGPLLLLALLSFGFLWHRISMDFPNPGSFTESTPPDEDFRAYQATVLDRPEIRNGIRLPEWATDPRVVIPCELESVTDGGFSSATSGKVLIRCPKPPWDLTPGERLRIIARFRPFSEPLNPGEPAPYLWWRRKGTIGILDARQAPFVLTDPMELGYFDLQYLLSLKLAKNILPRIKDWAESRLEQCIGTNNPQTNLAKALLLGDTQTVDFADWDKFKKTGTIHALAISGQHLVIAGILIGTLLSILGFAPRPSLLISTLFVVIYAILTGAAPSANRAAIMAIAFAWTLLIRRRTSVLNIIALAWILVGLFQPSDLGTPGCQLSFLAVFLLDAWQRRPDGNSGEPNPTEPGKKLEILESQLAPNWQKTTQRFFSTFREAYLVNGWVWLGICPLIAWHTNLVSLTALLIGPLVAVACTGGLIFGMLGILIPIPYLENLFGGGVVGFLNLSNWLASWGENLPMSWFYLPNLPLLGLLAWLAFLGWITLREVPLMSSGYICAGAIFLISLLATTFWRNPPKDLLIQSLAVGHGTAILVEDPSGRVLLYDGGSMSGGEAASRKISQVLWHRGISAIDEIIVSHADSDHFNALTGIFDKFRVGMVSVGPSFAARDDRETEAFYGRLHLRGIPIRTVYTGLNAISGITSFEILHPDKDYTHPPNQNAASVVVRIEYLGKSTLLTGDLESPGTEFFLASREVTPVSVLMAPHHGSPAANPEKLWRRLNPAFIFSSEGDEKRSKAPGGLWGRGKPFWKTQEKGMITIKIDKNGITAQAFKTGEVLRVMDDHTGG